MVPPSKPGKRGSQLMLFRNLRTPYLALTALALLSTGCPGGDKPTINSFSATPMTVQENATTTLAWDVTDADTIKITATPGGEVVSTTGIPLGTAKSRLSRSLAAIRAGLADEPSAATTRGQYA